MNAGFEPALNGGYAHMSAISSLFEGLSWQRPLALTLLVLPLIALWFARLLARPEPEATGTLEIWRRTEREAPRSGARARTRVPPSIVLLAIALALGVLALAGPRLGDAATRKCIVVVDRSPSMYVGDRMQRASNATRALLVRANITDVEWIAPPSHEHAIGAEMPAEWLVAPDRPRDEPDFAAHDEVGTMWLTDRAPKNEPRRAGIVASGGAFVPGPVGVADGHRLDWDGTRLRASDDVIALDPVRIASDVPAPIARVLGAWAAARGRVVETVASNVAAALELRGVGVANGARDVDPDRDLEFGRDGWSARGRGASVPLVDADGPLERWLADSSGSTTLVATAAGRITLGLKTCEEPRGDPAAFAVSWSRVFDACVLPPRGCVSVAERADAGVALEREPRFESSASGSTSAWPAYLALAATVFGIAALALGMRASSHASLLGRRAP